MKRHNVCVFALILCFLLSIHIFAHSGRTDSKGGHWDESNGTYHYHTGEYAGNNTSDSSDKIEHTDYTDNSKGNVTFQYIFSAVTLLGVIIYIITTRKSTKEDICHFEEQSAQSFALNHPIITWYILYSVVFFIVMLVSLSRGKDLDQAVVNVLTSAVVSMILPLVMALIVFTFVYFGDKAENKRISKNGCYVKIEPEKEVTYQMQQEHSYYSKHPYWPMVYIFCIYVFFLLLSVLACPLNDKADVFVYLFIFIALMYICSPIALFIPLLIFYPLIGKCRKITSSSKLLVCRNCGHENSTTSLTCAKCGIDFLCFDMPIDSKSMMDVCFIPNIHSISTDYCQRIISIGNYSFYSYDVSKYTEKCLLRLDNRNNAVVYFGKCFELNCIYGNSLYSVNRRSENLKKHFVCERNVITGKTVYHYWFSPGTIWDSGTYCQDTVNQMYATENSIVIEVHRTKSSDFPEEYSKYLHSKYNVDTDYIITATECDSEFVIEKYFTDIFPSDKTE